MQGDASGTSAASAATAPQEVAVQYFDGQTARPRTARVRATGADLEIVDAADGAPLRRVTRAQVQWPERQRHGPRVAHLEGGGMLHCNDHAAWDAFAATA